MRTSLKRSTLLLAATLVACGGGTRKPPPLPPLPSIAMPTGAQLKPFNTNNPTKPRPSSMVALGGQVYVALGNLDANFNPGGPGMLVSVVPSAGVQSTIDLGGTQCTNAGFVRTDGTRLFASCTGSFPPSPSGQQVVEVDPVSATVTRRFATLPPGFLPGPLAVGPTKIWVGDTSFTGTRVISIDRATFTLVDGADAAHPAIQLPCGTTNKFFSVGGLLVVGTDLFAICEAKDGYLSRLDATTGVVKETPQIVGGIPVALTLTGDGRIAIADSVSSEIALVTPLSTGLAVHRDPIPNSTDLEDVAARNQFLYVANASAQTIVKVDISNGFRIVDSRSVLPNTNPRQIVMLDDDVALVSDYDTGNLVTVRFDVPAK